MIMLKYLAVFIFLTVLSGCTKPCVLPGQNSEDPAVSCYYQIVVTDIDVTNNKVTGKLPDHLYVKGTNREIEAPEKSKEEFPFRVRDLEQLVNTKQIVKNNRYEFVRQGNSPYLELLP